MSRISHPCRKLGAGRAWEMWDRGWRELGGFLYPESNILQPMYPQRGGYSLLENREPAKQPSVLEDALARAHDARDDPGKDDRGMDRD